jgi:preprotein translocase subunit SecE
MTRKKSTNIFLSVLAVCAIMAVVLYPSIWMILPLFLATVALVVFLFVFSSLAERHLESLSLSEKIMWLRKRTTKADILRVFLVVTVFLVLIAIYFWTPDPLYILPIFLLIAYGIIKSLNNKHGVEDEIDELVFNTQIDKLKLSTKGCHNAELPLSPEDVLALTIRGRQRDHKMFQKMVNENKKLFIKGFITSKLDYENESNWTIGKELCITVPHIEFDSVRIGDFVEIEIVRPPYATISTVRPVFILKLEIIERYANLISDR